MIPTQSNSDTLLPDLLTFWFGHHPDDGLVAEQQAALWWRKSADNDALIRERYEGLPEAAAAGDLDHWNKSAEGRLGIILVLDQLPRVLYRGQARAFAFDALARERCLHGLRVAVDQALRPIQRVFFYLPLEHSENLQDQQRCLQSMQQLAAEVRPAWRQTFGSYVEFARAHIEIIERFGRFPHRNQALGRESSAAELAFLEQPGSAF